MQTEQERKTAVVNITDEVARDGILNWAAVELYRWEHGRLPPGDNTEKSLNFPNAMEKMGEAVEDSKVGPFSTAQVLKGMAIRMRNLEERVADNFIGEIERFVDDKKGTANLTYDYHTNTWAAYYCDKRGNVRANTVTDEGEGQHSIDGAFAVLLKELEQV